MNHLINEDIQSERVRLVSEPKANPMDISLNEAMKIANDSGLDLIMFGGDEHVAICRLGDYKKFMYKRNKVLKGISTNGKKKTKEIRIGHNIEYGDIVTKAKAIDRILRSGDNVNVSMYTNRSRVSSDVGILKIKKLLSLVTEKYKVATDIKEDKSRIYIILRPER